ncbi:MAG TPA: hypothetical protein VNQ81_17290 [Povalibacter sp.]|nr:hypothetical protein [Povalibacter sp.]
MRLPSTRFLGDALPTTISAGAVALLLLSISARPAAAQTGIEPDRNGYLEMLLVQHDVRYALQTDEWQSVGCPFANTAPQSSTGSAHGLSTDAKPEVVVAKPVAQERAATQEQAR